MRTSHMASSRTLSLDWQDRTIAAYAVMLGMRALGGYGYLDREPEPDMAAKIDKAREMLHDRRKHPPRPVVVSGDEEELEAYAAQRARTREFEEVRMLLSGRRSGMSLAAAEAVLNETESEIK